MSAQPIDFFKLFLQISQVAAIPFPSREIFSLNSSESVARNRRRHLEIYLRRLLIVCSKIPQCPIYEGANGFGLCKTTLIEFSGFFKKGLFESGKHGTGWDRLYWTLMVPLSIIIYYYFYYLCWPLMLWIIILSDYLPFNEQKNKFR